MEMVRDPGYEALRADGYASLQVPGQQYLSVYDSISGYLYPRVNQGDDEYVLPQN